MVDAPAEWKVSEIKDGKGTIQHGDRYSISLNESNSTWELTDNCDGGMSTVGITPWGTSGTTLSSSQTITNGDNTIKLTGIGINNEGANHLKVEQSHSGRQLVAQTSDGAFTAKESGKGWRNDGKPTDQATVNA